MDVDHPKPLTTIIFRYIQGAIAVFPACTYYFGYNAIDARQL